MHRTLQIPHLGRFLIPSTSLLPSLQRATRQVDVQRTWRSPANMEPRGVYVHLPFCKRRCYYCDFPIQVLGQKETSAARIAMSHYVALLLREIEYTTSVGQSPLQTLSFGGGTPSLIPPSDLQLIITALEKKFNFERGMEMSMEADPGTFDRAKLKAYLELGVSRVSLGVQSFDEEVLRSCGRSHTLKEVFSAVEDLQSSGVASWSLDLISGLPHVDLASWKSTLDCALDANSDHVSIYDLQVEDSTPFGRWYAAEVAPLPSQELAAEMYRVAVKTLSKAGYEHYEISNFARAGHRSRHNMLYWDNAAFYGFGLGATSNAVGVRLTRPRRMQEYESWVNEMPEQEVESAPSKPDDVLETVMLRLRLRDGIDLEAFQNRHGLSAVETLKQSAKQFCEEKTMECLDVHRKIMEWSGDWQDVRYIRLADPEGFLISNTIIADIFCQFE